MAFEDWEKDKEGNVKIYPLSGYDTFRPYGMLCGLRVQYVSSDAQLHAGEFQALPLVMTVAQARDMAAALNRAADIAEQPPSDEPRQ